MCYNFKTSILSFLAGIASGLFAIFTGQIILGWLIMFYCQIQLAEAIIWYGIDMDSVEINKIGTFLLKYLLATHLIGVGIGVYTKTGNFYPLILGVLFFFGVVILYAFNPGASTIYPKHEGGRLQWNFPQWWYMISFVLIMLVFWKYVSNIWSKVFITAAYILTLLWAVFGSSSVGSIWCWLSAVLAPLIVLINWIIIRNTV